MIIEVKISKDFVVRADVDCEQVLTIESHVTTVAAHKAAVKAGDTACMDVIGAAYVDEKEEARAAARALFQQSLGKDKRERIALRKIAMKGLRTLR